MTLTDIADVGVQVVDEEGVTLTDLADVGGGQV